MIMDIKDAHKVVDSLQTRPFICSENTIELDNGYVIAKKEYFNECREAREKQRAKKPILDVIYHQQYYCPNCEDFLARKNGDKPHHCICGQAIDWSDTD